MSIRCLLTLKEMKGRGDANELIASRKGLWMIVTRRQSQRGDNGGGYSGRYDFEDE